MVLILIWKLFQSIHPCVILPSSFDSMFSIFGMISMFSHIIVS
uniref:Uncharacterized protein n=1 Tax=Arundo donax TaxID=35708 RepID=A0A0A9D568_ARUDO